jgi:uncharacterized membrane-anchored protein YitT (DUF2179 family)
MTRNTTLASILAGTTALVIGLAIQEYIIPAIGTGALGLVWVTAYNRKIFRAAAPAFALFVFISAAGIWGGVSAWLALACVIFSLIAWDLTVFIQQLQLTNQISDRKKLERTHFIQLALVIGISLLGVFSGTLIRLKLTFGGAALLAMLGIWGISALVYRLRRHEDEVDS